jgi:hypothetical protein
LFLSITGCGFMVQRLKIFSSLHYGRFASAESDI